MKAKIFFAVTIFSVLFISCSDMIDQQREMINIKLSPSFIGISQDVDQPMGIIRRAQNDFNPNQIVYAIQVYENDSAYSYGLFDDTNKMQIAVTTENNYHFKVVAFKVGTGKGLKQEVEDGIKCFYLPNKIFLSNKFYKGDALKDIDKASSVRLAGTEIKDYPEIDGFYCAKTVKVEKGLDNINFVLFRMGFGVTFNVDKLTNGTVFVMMGNDTIKLTSDLPTKTSIRLFNSIYNFTQIYNKAETFSDSILVKIRWEGTNGTVFTDESFVKFLRNYQKTINIKLNTTGLNFTFEDWNSVPNYGLIGWWPFNGSPNDESNVKNSTENFGATLTVDRFGRSDNAYSFDGKTSFIEIIPKQEVSQINDFTISMWAKNEGWLYQTNNRQYLFDGHAGNRTDAGNYLREGFMIFSEKLADSTNITGGILYSSYNYSDGFYRKVSVLSSTNFFAQWHNIVLIRKGDHISTYIDKVLYQSGSGVSKDQQLNMLHPWYIGAFCGNNPNYNVSGNPANYSYCGVIDDIRIYNRALSDSEIQLLYDEQ